MVWLGEGEEEGINGTVHVRGSTVESQQWRHEVFGRLGASMKSTANIEKKQLMWFQSILEKR